MKKQYLVIGAVIIVIVIFLAAFSFFLPKNSPTTKESNVTTNPFLWKIEGEVTSYLYGSIHIPNIDILTIPDVVYEALVGVDQIYTEVALDPEYQIRSLELSVLPGDQTLDDVLPEDVLHKLQTYLSSEGLSYQDFSRFKIWAVASSLPLLEETENFLKYIALDQYIWNLGDSNGIFLNEIESVEQQVEIFDSFTIDEQARMLSDTIDQLEDYKTKGKSVTGEIIEAYLDGDLQALQDLTFADYDENDPYDVKFIETLLTNRNIIITKTISEIIKDKPETQYFFTIGAGHFYGEHGLVTLLEQEGFTITRVDFDICEECDSGEIMIEGRCYIPYS